MDSKPINGLYQKIDSIKNDNTVLDLHSSSSSGVSSDLSSEENCPGDLSTTRQRTGRPRMTNPPPKPARQFLPCYQDTECLYAGNMTYEQMENTEGKMVTKPHSEV